MNPTDLKKQVQSGKCLPFYILAGEEDFLKKEAVACLKETLVRDPLNFEKYAGKDASIAQVIESASTMTFFGDKKLVVAEDADHLLKEADQLIGYLANPSPAACLVLAVDAIDRRTKLFKEADRLGAVVECNPLYPQQVRTWAAHYVKRAGKGIDDDALDALIDAVGTSLSDVVSEVEKIMLYAGTRPRITLSDVETIVVRMRTEDVFELINAISAKDKRNALRLLIRLMEEGKDSFELIGLLRWQFIRLFQADEQLRSGKSEYDVAASFRIPPKYSGKFFSTVRLFAREDKVAYLQMLLDADVSVKKGTACGAEAMENLIIGLCG
jgi:DNA polymerase-3 subunit delta